ncbi:MAG: methyl-accepting chemotaxis protein [Fimbriimonadales bacterium]|nr:methyl-accepting chemotaxis protein [Fimbriimonadales bacterium]
MSNTPITNRHQWHEMSLLPVAIGVVGVVGAVSNGPAPLLVGAIAAASAWWWLRRRANAPNVSRNETTPTENLAPLEHAMQQWQTQFQRLEQAITQLHQGNLLYRIEAQGDDATARLYNEALDYFVQSLQETRQTAKLVLQSVQAMIEGLTDAAERSEQVGGMAQDTARGVEHLAYEIQSVSESVRQVQQAAQEVAQGAEQTAQSASVGVERVNLIVQRIREAAHQLQRVEQATEQTTQIASEGRAALHQSQQVMQQIEQQTRHTADEIQQLATMSAAVSDILSKIEEIARQINLLALNAAIEAARAGEAGRGFAVVADEVRRLAERSAQASKEIQQIIDQVLGKTHATVQAIEQNLTIVQQGGRVSQEVAQGLQTILQAIDEIAQQVSSSTALMQEVQQSADMTLGEIEQIAAIAQQSSAASQEMLASAETSSQALHQMAALSQQAAANAEQTSQIVHAQIEAIQRLNRQNTETSAAVEKLMFSLGRFRLSEEESFEEKIQTFKRAHLKWVERVERMVYHGEMIPRDQLVSHKKCALGTWYYSLGQQQFGHLPEFRAIEPPHERLHQIAARAVEAMEQNDKARAQQCLNEIREVSQEIVAKLDQLYTRATTSGLQSAA